ncbi:glutamine synthetase-like protein [Leptotrombidium deliense]|uniref:glutamine synthetase n=1 Tax=Leptotrombidium deliense TaxID=299467 RepID=A0A443SSU7_9ACAR|nr:glutamine synthetase-like protein [Leptotrombidium deliense]
MSNFDLLQRYMKIKQPDDKVQLCYLWIHSEGNCLRAKSLTVSFVPTHPDQVPLWKCAGSANVGYNAEFTLMPVALYDDPFREGKNKIVLCELGDIYDKPPIYNKRHNCLQAFKTTAELYDPWTQVTQTYTLLDDCDEQPLGWPKNGYPEPRSHYYCGVGTGKTFGRDIAEAHYRACLYAGIGISSVNAHFIPSNWQYQIGYARSIAVIDDLWTSRFLLTRLAEHFGVRVSYDQQQLPGVKNCKTLYLNFSSKQMREKNGFRFNNEIVLEKNCDRHKCTLNFQSNDGKEVVKEFEKVKEGDLQSQSKSGESVNVPKESEAVKFEQVSDEESGFVQFCATDSVFDPYEITMSIVNKVCLNQ